MLFTSDGVPADVDVYGLATLLDGVTTTGAGDAIRVEAEPERAFQAIVEGTGAVAATVDIEVALDGLHFFKLDTIELNGTTSDTDGFSDTGPWPYVRANVTAISGVGATATVLMGV